MATIEFKVTRRITCLADEVITYKTQSQNIESRMAQGMTEYEAVVDVLRKGECNRSNYECEIDETVMEHECILEVL